MPTSASGVEGAGGGLDPVREVGTWRGAAARRADAERRRLDIDSAMHISTRARSAALSSRSIRC
jgi:hypothetical protein